MAKLFFHPLGSAIDVEDQSFQENCKDMASLEETLTQKRISVKNGWGKKYQERVQAKNKLTAYQRLESLCDAKEKILFINSFVNDGIMFGEGSQQKTCPNAGVLTAFVQIHDRWTIVIANDNTVASGAWWPKTPEKIIRAQEIALKLSLPVIYLVDCSGLFLPEQSKSFPGKTGAGHIFKMNSLLSNQGIPQIAGVCGDCIAGGGYMPIISDRVYMTEQAYMVIAGAALIRGAKSQHLSSHDIGGPHVHVHISNCADERVPDDHTMLIKIREEIRKLPSSANTYYRSDSSSEPPKYATKEIAGILPISPKKSYDIRQVIARLIDDSLFWEFDKEKGQEVVCGIAKVSGLFVGFLANSQELFAHPEKFGQQRPGGILYRDGVKKLSRFCRVLNDDGIPMVWLQDVSGFDVGAEAEKQGLLSYGSSLIYANSTHNTPMMTVLLRKASGAGYYAMAGMPYDPVLQISTPCSRLAVMEGQTLAIGAFNTKLDDNFAIMSKDPEERKQIEAGMNQVIERIERDMDPYKAALNLDTDEVVAVGEIRRYLECFVECTYQNIGKRRIKNSRIWSLHDMDQ
ncbi:MAG: propionyl-CoA carboxylase [Myxococcales bacterium]|nr:propionyl-CoA carboxylase [Myxococcales bacterium]USN50108.1 MAG: propionyl-CoA carboxylase [Myxococcales bacterium]